MFENRENSFLALSFSCLIMCLDSNTHDNQNNKINYNKKLDILIKFNRFIHNYNILGFKKIIYFNSRFYF